MPEKQVNLELVSSYTLVDDFYEQTPVEVKEHDTVPAGKLNRRDWGINVCYEWYMNEELFPHFEDLANDSREIVVEVYVLDDKGVRNGKAQCVVWTTFGGDVTPYVLWDAMYKNGQLHGAYRTYNAKVVSKLADKTFYIDGRAADAKTVAEWRKVQSVMNAKAKSKQIKGR